MAVGRAHHGKSVYAVSLALEFEKQVKCTATLFILPPPMAIPESDPYVAPAY